MNYAKMTKAELLEEVARSERRCDKWLKKCSEMEAQLASARLVMQPFYQKFKVEDEGCDCEICKAMRDLFEKPGGRALVEDYRECRLAIEEAFQILGSLMAEAEVSRGRMQRATVWLAKLAGRQVG